jgi:hypothetical protein
VRGWGQQTSILEEHLMGRSARKRKGRKKSKANHGKRPNS